MTDKKAACRRAVKAAMEVMSEECGGFLIEIGGNMIQVPSDIVEIKAKSNPNREEAIRAIAGSTWARNWAVGMGRFAVGAEPSKEMVDRLARQLAEEVVGAV